MSRNALQALVRAFVGALSFISAAGSAQQESIPTYRVGTVAFALAPGASIGSKRSGALCLPAGGVAWRESRPGMAEAAGAVMTGLREAGLRMLAVDEPASGSGDPPQIVDVRVDALRLSACVPPGGLGRLLNHSRTIKGDGLIATVWTLREGNGGRAVRTGRVCLAFSYRGTDGTLADMTLSGLSKAAGAAATMLAGGSAPEAVEAAFCGKAGAAGDAQQR